MSINSLNKLEKQLDDLIPKYREVNKLNRNLKNMDSVVNQRNNNFVQFILSIYFKKVLDKANKKLLMMTDNLYYFIQPEEGKIAFSIFDNATNSERGVKTLSGGETFLASLALALGFSEVVEEENGGIRLDTIFIDEGFGSLDPEYLEKALEVLNRLSKDRKVIIISHVELLKEKIAQKIIVQKDNFGESTLKIEKF